MAELLRDAAGSYLFVSSISVYADPSRPTIEDDAVAPLSDPASEDVPRDYGALKAACEREVAAIYGERAINVRPGLIVGPWDPTGRFTYWVHRASSGGEMLAPDHPRAIVQVIDARDLAAWMVRLVESRASGVFNASGPVGSVCDFGRLVDVCIDVGNAGTKATWVDGAFLLEHKVAPWTELPVWLPPEDGGLLSVDLGRAAAAGLVTRALVETVRDTLAWRMNTPDASRNERVPGAGISREREAQLLAAWRARDPGSARVPIQPGSSARESGLRLGSPSMRGSSQVNPSQANPTCHPTFGACTLASQSGNRAVVSSVSNVLARPVLGSDRCRMDAGCASFARPSADFNSVHRSPRESCARRGRIPRTSRM